MGLIAPLDAAFLFQEAREHPMHVGGLQLYHTPSGVDEDYVGNLYRELLAYQNVAPLFRRRPHDPVESLGNIWWKTETDVDVEYHVRRSALPRPGRVRELLELVSRLHGSLLDRHRPLWEYHLIEGLADGRFASYAKCHHALADGITLTRKVLASCSPDAQVRGMPPMWAAEADDSAPASASKRRIGNPVETFRNAGRSLMGFRGMGGMMAEYGRAALKDQTAVLPYEAPRSMLNKPISGSRRVAAQSWDIARVLKVAKARGVTLNDIVMAMSAGALRRYLMANDALPRDPLIASVPVSMRTRDDNGGGGGNAITFVLCNLATNLENPDERLEAITSSMRATKAVMANRPAVQLAAMGVLTAVGPAVLTRIPGSSSGPPPYNVLISNVPGPRERLYWNGAELEAIYPLSIPTENQALNITCLSYADHLEFGLVGCRRAVPKLQRLLDYLEDSLQELE
jgi:WS/DGAT/MGAT family acyltransferase